MPRPVQYNLENVTASATRLFWLEGYGGSSVDKLLRATGLNKHSLYKAFNGKEGLFIRCLEHYIDNEARPYRDVLANNHGLGAIRSYFQRVTRRTRHHSNMGCLVANTAAELGDGHSQVSKRIDAYYRDLAGLLSRAVAQGQDIGEIRSDIDPLDIAKCLVHMVQGISISHRFRSPVAADTESLLQLIAQPPGKNQ
ncbi:TetR/AcrR family transcriptional regulator [Parahaliea mediterranea]|uniref:TetR/AcrR family transcriptional regulator n=1 Tax=Parahaliea mediterranea TaxID=651086 RepID=A0A939IJK2_9GAMM|nr:TetR/AcrR family transcriptional regulator [Parahaliea mediterranea]MBN7796381.1 TetR/AcrR family transcriptional regulator [Parahaliea mediterranea]